MLCSWVLYVSCLLCAYECCVCVLCVMYECFLCVGYNLIYCVDMTSNPFNDFERQEAPCPI